MIRCGLDGDVYRLDYIGGAMVVGLFYAPFFISGLFGWCVMMRGGVCVGVD